MTAYVVVAGDTFAIISRKRYGVESQSGLIQRANPGVVEPLQLGAVLVIPPTSIFGDLPEPTQQAPASSPDEIAIRIDGKLLRQWDTVTITQSIDSFSTFTLTAPFDSGDFDLREQLRPLSFKPVEITLGGAVLFNGTMMNAIPSVSPNSVTVDVNGYSLAAVLNDCPPPSSMYPVEYDGFSLFPIAKVLAEPFGVAISMIGESGDVFETAAIRPDQTVLSFLATLAKQRNFVISNTSDGKLLFWQSVASGSPVARFFDGSTVPVVSVTPNFDPQQFFSSVTALASADIGSNGKQYTVQNDRLRGIVRPSVFNAQDTDPAGLQVAAQSKIARQFGNAATYTLELNTWRNDQNGQIWQPNTTIQMFDPNAMIYQDYEFLVRNVTLTRDADSERAVLDLVLPGAFSGQIPEVLPWDS